MAELDVLGISASALSAHRRWMDVIADNLANAETTRTADGSPFRRKMVVFEETPSGVSVKSVEEDLSPPRMVYDPSHPDADASGFVQFPNVNTIHEMVDMMTATRAYEANVAAFNATKSMLLKALEIGRV